MAIRIIQKYKKIIKSIIYYVEMKLMRKERGRRSINNTVLRD